MRFDVGDRDEGVVDAIDITDDMTDEEDETFRVIATLATGTDSAAVTIAKGTGTVTITRRRFAGVCQPRRRRRPWKATAASGSWRA